MNPGKKQQYIGMGLAVLSAMIWSGNFIVARGIIKQLPPVSISFYRWGTAVLIMLPFAWKSFSAEKAIVFRHWRYLLLVSFAGISLYNTFIYIAGHHSPAINLALIGTTSSPVFAIILAAIFLREKITSMRITGLLICIAGIVLLLSKGSWDRLKAFQFSTGDVYMLIAGLLFAIYNVLARKKPEGISPLNFLFTICLTGTLLLLPFFLWETSHAAPVQWNGNLLLIVLYLGLGNSFIAYLCWNASIARLGAARTALFGNLIPVFSSLEAVLILGEELTSLHWISGILVIAGLVIATIQSTTATKTTINTGER